MRSGMGESGGPCSVGPPADTTARARSLRCATRGEAVRATAAMLAPAPLGGTVTTGPPARSWHEWPAAIDAVCDSGPPCSWQLAADSPTTAPGAHAN